MIISCFDLDIAATAPVAYLPATSMLLLLHCAAEHGFGVPGFGARRGTRRVAATQPSQVRAYSFRGWALGNFDGEGVVHNCKCWVGPPFNYPQIFPEKKQADVVLISNDARARWDCETIDTCDITNT